VPGPWVAMRNAGRCIHRAGGHSPDSEYISTRRKHQPSPCLVYPQAPSTARWASLSILSRFSPTGFPGPGFPPEGAISTLTFTRRVGWRSDVDCHGGALFPYHVPNRGVRMIASAQITRAAVASPSLSTRPVESGLVQAPACV
jgi:hypothetical protein